MKAKKSEIKTIGNDKHASKENRSLKASRKAKNRLTKLDGLKIFER